jgi:hypothetical protein
MKLAVNPEDGSTAQNNVGLLTLCRYILYRRARFSLINNTVLAKCMASTIKKSNTLSGLLKQEKFLD